MPPDRLKKLAARLHQGATGTNLLDEAKKRSWEVEHLTGEELQGLAKEVIDQPADIVERVKQLMETK